MESYFAEASQSLSSIATGRDESMFLADLARNKNTITEAIAGRKILAIGAAGSIGSNTVFTLCQYAPAIVHIIDQNENALAELVRQYRSSLDMPRIGEMRALPLDYGAVATEMLLSDEAPYDIILNFAAIKHVRSEKDTYSIFQMLDTNIVKQARLMRWIARHSPNARYFSVSTDKAANPSSFMGATKRLMEHVMFESAFREGFKGAVTSARFANVAYSNGSLLQSFQNRMARREPIACPRDIKRYFVSLAESGHICTLASLLAPDNHIGIPNLDPNTCLVPLQEIARRFIRKNGYEPIELTDEEEAKRDTARYIRAGRWPLILTMGDTAGEKPYEEFVAVGETVSDIGLSSISAIPHQSPPSGSIEDLVNALEEIVLGRTDGVADKDTIKALVGQVEPEFLATHRESSLSLDHRM